jgi:hypothetical protein
MTILSLNSGPILLSRRSQDASIDGSSGNLDPRPSKLLTRKRSRDSEDEDATQRVAKVFGFFWLCLTGNLTRATYGIPWVAAVSFSYGSLYNAFSGLILTLHYFTFQDQCLEVITPARAMNY